MATKLGNAKLWSIIIATHNPSGRLVKSIKKLRSCIEKSSNNGEIIVVNDKSDNLFDFNSLKKIYKNIKIINNAINIGQAKSANLGASKARGELLIFLDDDCIPVTNEFIKDFISDYHKGHEVISGSVIAENNKNIESIRFKQRVEGGDRYIKPKDLQGGCLGIDRELFRHINGFSENIKYFYDLELGYNIESMGEKIYKDVNIVVIHQDTDLSLDGELNKTYKAYLGSFQAVIKKHANAVDAFPWGNRFENDGNSYINKLLYGHLAFYPIYITYKYTHKIMPVGISREIYNYLHRCAIYYAVKGKDFINF